MRLGAARFGRRKAGLLPRSAAPHSLAGRVCRSTTVVPSDNPPASLLSAISEYAFIDPDSLTIDEDIKKSLRNDLDSMRALRRRPRADAASSRGARYGRYSAPIVERTAESLGPHRLDSGAPGRNPSSCLEPLDENRLVWPAGHSPIRRNVLRCRGCSSRGSDYGPSHSSRNDEIGRFLDGMRPRVVSPMGGQTRAPRPDTFARRRLQGRQGTVPRHHT